jgi:hypothetical protein
MPNEPGSPKPVPEPEKADVADVYERLLSKQTPKDREAEERLLRDTDEYDDEEQVRDAWDVWLPYLEKAGPTERFFWHGCSWDETEDPNKLKGIAKLARGARTRVDGVLAEVAKRIEEAAEQPNRDDLFDAVAEFGELTAEQERRGPQSPESPEAPNPRRYDPQGREQEVVVLWTTRRELIDESDVRSAEALGWSRTTLRGVLKRMFESTDEVARRLARAHQQAQARAKGGNRALLDHRLQGDEPPQV